MIDFGSGPDADNVLLAFQNGMAYEVRHGGWVEGRQEQPNSLFSVMNVEEDLHNHGEEEDEHEHDEEDPPSFPVSTWTHVAVVQSRTGDATTGPAKIYWDGVEVASTESMNFPLLVSRSGLYVGKSHWPDPMFTGSMRDLLIWDVALTTAELDAVRLGGGLPTSTAPLVSMMRTWCGAAPPPSPPPPSPPPPSQPPPSPPPPSPPPPLPPPPSPPPPSSPPPSPPSSPPPVSPTGVCGDGTILDASTQQCEILLGEGTEVAGGRCEITCSDDRRLEEAQTAEAVVDGFLARHLEAATQLNEETIMLMHKLGQDFGLPALA